MDTYNSEIINQQNHLIKQLFNMLDMPDVIYEFEKISPFNVLHYSSKYIEYAPYDLILEEPCIFGPHCLYKKTPYLCPRNHQKLGKIIKKGSAVPKYLCKYERPWKILRDTNKPMKCNNVNCWFTHLKGRKEHLNNILLELFV